MRDYRAYILGVEEHRFVWVEDFLADHPNDVAAIDAAKKLSDSHDVELWDGSRLVGRFSPDGNEVRPELAPSLVFTVPSDKESNSVKPAEPISLSRVSELALADSSEGNRFL
jgi:hypothetical protein